MTALRPLPICADRFIEQVPVAVIPRDARVVSVDQHDVELETPPIIVGDLFDRRGAFAEPGHQAFSCSHSLSDGL